MNLINVILIYTFYSGIFLIIFLCISSLLIFLRFYNADYVDMDKYFPTSYIA